MICDFKELEAWKKSVDLTETIYHLSASFPKEEVFGLTSQMCRSAVSIPSHIAEGSSLRIKGITAISLYSPWFCRRARNTDHNSREAGIYRRCFGSHGKPYHDSKNAERAYTLTQEQ